MIDLLQDGDNNIIFGGLGDGSVFNDIDVNQDGIGNKVIFSSQWFQDGVFIGGDNNIMFINQIGENYMFINCVVGNGNNIIVNQNNGF